MIVEFIASQQHTHVIHIAYPVRVCFAVMRAGPQWGLGLIGHTRNITETRCAPFCVCRFRSLR